MGAGYLAQILQKPQLHTPDPLGSGSLPLELALSFVKDIPNTYTTLAIICYHAIEKL